MNRAQCGFERHIKRRNLKFFKYNEKPALQEALMYIVLIFQNDLILCYTKYMQGLINSPIPIPIPKHGVAFLSTHIASIRRPQLHFQYYVPSKCFDSTGGICILMRVTKGHVHWNVMTERKCHHLIAYYSRHVSIHSCSMLLFIYWLLVVLFNV